MKRDRLQKTDGSVAKSPKECGGVVMELEKSMKSVLRVAMVAVMAMVFGLAGFAASASAAPVSVVNQFGPPCATGTTANALTCNSPTVGAGSSRVMVVVVTGEGSGNHNPAATTATYGSATFTQVQNSDGNNDNRRYTWIGYINEAQIAANAGSNIVTTSTTNVNWAGKEVYYAVYASVDQTSPVSGSAQGDSPGGTTNVSMGAFNTVVDGAGIYAIAANTGTSNVSTVPTGYTEHRDNADASNNYNSTIGSRLNLPGTTQTITMTSGDVRWTGVAMALAPLSCVADPAPTTNGGNFSGNPVDICGAATAGTNTITNYEVTGGGPNLDDSFNDGSLDAKWTKTDVGPDATGAPVESGGTLTLSGGGADIWNAADEFTFLHQQITGDFTMEVNVQSLNNNGGNAWHKSGLMARETLNGNSVNVNLMVTPGNGVTFEQRLTTGVNMVSTADAVGTTPKWLRIQRIGNSWRAWWSNNGTAWTENTGGAVNVTLPNTIYIGMAVTSHAPGTIDSAVFDDFVATSAASSILYSGASCSGIDSTSWTDATYGLNVTYSDSCGTTNQTTSGTFDFNTCSESTQSSIIWNGTNTAAGNFAGASFVTATDITGATLQYKVTGLTGGGAPFEELEYFDANNTFNDWSNWTPSNPATGNQIGNGLLGTRNTNTNANGATLTPSAGTGPTSVHSGGVNGGFLFIEASGTGPYNNRTFTRNTTFDADAYEPNISYAFEGWGANLIDMSFQVNDGSGWTSEWVLTGADANNNGTWQTADINLNNGTINIDGAGYVSTSTVGGTGAAYTSGSLQMRFLINTNSFEGDYSLDTIRVYGNARATQSTLIDWTSDPIPASANLTDATSYEIFARGNDPECGTTYYGDSIAQTAAEGTGQSFTWSSCNETATVNVNDPGVISGTTAIVVTVGGAGGVSPQWSADGGTTWYNSGQSYTPPASCASGAITIIGKANGTCGVITDPTPVNGSYDTTDSGPGGDLAVLTVTPSGGSVTGVVNVQVAVGTETVPDSLNNVVLNVTGSTSCNDTNSVMTWNAGASRWEASWDTSACGTGSVESGVTLTASANDSDCGDFVTGFSTTTIDNTCSDGSSSVSWTPPGGTITTPTVVTAVRSGGTPGFDQVSFNNGIDWVASGSTYTPPVDDHGTVNFLVRAYDNCGKWMYGGPYAVNIDGRLDSVRPLSVTATAAGKTTIRVLLRYASDGNNNAGTTVRYKLASGLTWTTVGPVVDGGDADAAVNENVLFMLTSLTTDEVYDIEVNVTDADGVDWTTLQGAQPAAPPWTGTVRLTSWTDVSMLHNALRFACSEIGYADETSCVANGGTWNLNRKWAGGWGLPDAQYPGAKYDGFECSTCHMKDSSNVKRVVDSVLARTGSFPGSTVNLQSAAEGTADFGDDSDSHTTSNRVCEVCHSVTQYHRFDTSGQINLNHNNNTDCIRCHEHKVGFRASCDSCHGTPPVSALGLVTTDPTGSTVWGEHQKHAVELGFDCNTCHTGWDTTNMMPNGGNINIGFGADVNPRFNGAVNNVNGGTYEGRPSANGSYSADASTGTSVTQDTAVADMSCAIYCHGYGTPIWNPTSTVACGSCHGAVGSGVGDRSGAPTGVGASKDLSGLLTGYKVGKHATHIDDSIFQTGDPCALCHAGFGYSDSTHVNGTVNIALKLASQSLTPTTTGGAGLTGAFTPGVPGVSPGSCDNMDCHGYTPWDSAAKLTCTQACHGYPPTTTTNFTNYNNFSFVDHNTPNGEQYLRDNHGQCKYCHGWNDDGDGNLPISGMTVSELTAMQGDPAEAPNFFQYDSLSYTNGLHGNATITMNTDGDGNEANDAGYDPVTGGCNNAVCHGNDAAHQFNVTGNTNIMAAADIGPGDCGACHTTGVGGATIVTSSSPHTKVTKTGSFTSCGACHSGHYTKAGGVQIPNNVSVGINYTGTQHGGIKLGGPGTDASISGKTTEAEICWACHALAANNISEWGTNAKQVTTPVSPVPTQYNYGSLSNNSASSGGWYSVTTPGSEAGATWTSGKADFAYKTGAIQSTHAANDAGTSAVTGNNYEKVETLDSVANIRCSYCHDVHNAVGPNGAPYLRGTWWGNPYEEDGAPQSTQTYVNDTRFGAVPRGNGAKTLRLGGFWIDINNVRPGTATTGANGTAYVNPTASGGSGTGGAWTFSDSAGLCILCHTNNVSSMDKTTGESLWLGTANGHANAVIDGSGTGGTNIFNSRGGATNSNRAQMHWAGSGGRPEDWNSGFRNSAGDSQYSYAPLLNPLGENNENTTPNTNNWGSLTIDNTTVNSKYHKFSCSKCHNPHASRLPKLMITNCLDTKHNTWDDNKSLNQQNDTLNLNRSMSNYSSAQNCHRLGGIIPSNRVIPGTGGTYVEPVDTGAVGAPHQTGTSYGNRGWNYVTPW